MTRKVEKKGNGKNGGGEGKTTQRNSSPKKRKTASFFNNTSSLQPESPTPGTSRDIIPDLPNLPQVNEERYISFYVYISLHKTAVIDIYLNKF